MPEPSEKAVKNAFVGESGGDIPVVVQTSGSKERAQGGVYTESKRTWKSFFWSSELLILGIFEGGRSLTTIPVLQPSTFQRKKPASLPSSI